MLLRNGGMDKKMKDQATKEISCQLPRLLINDEHRLPCGCSLVGIKHHIKKVQETKCFVEAKWPGKPPKLSHRMLQ